MYGTPNSSEPVLEYFNIMESDLWYIPTTRGGLGYSRFTFTKWALDNYEPQDDRFSYHAIRKFYVLGDAASKCTISGR